MSVKILSLSYANSEGSKGRYPQNPREAKGNNYQRMGVPLPHKSSTNDKLFSCLKAMQSLNPGTTDAVEIARGAHFHLVGARIYLLPGGKWTRRKVAGFKQSC